MGDSDSSWRVVPYEGDSLYKKVRVRDEARIQAVLRHLQAQECVALLGPPLSEKSHLLRDVADALHEAGLHHPLMVNLWRARSNDEAAFFTSVAHLIAQTLGAPVAPPSSVPDARAFQNYLSLCLNAQDRHLALLIDHLQALPQDLVHSLLLALRAAYMERNVDAPNQLVAVVTGSTSLAGLAAGSTSPFNIAKPVLTAPMSAEQTLALAEATFEFLGCAASPGALQRIVGWVGGDHYLVPRVCFWSAEAVQGYRQPKVSKPIVDRIVKQYVLRGDNRAPMREAIRMIEEDPDTLLDVLDLLDHDTLPRTRSRQMITRTGVDRLQLCGAVVMAEGQYRFKNQAFRQALAGRFTTERVGHVLRIAGRWREAIDYLTPRLAAAQPALPAPLPATGSAGLGNDARPQLLEAIVQSIYATDSLKGAYEFLAQGLRLGFGLAWVSIYGADLTHGQLKLIYFDGDGPGPPPTIDLHDPACVEAQAFHYGHYALRGAADEARLVVTLVAHQRPIGLVTVDRYVKRRDPHEPPQELPDLLRFLEHAASAIENVTLRSAYRKIGQAVLNASTLQSTLNQVLALVSGALGCHYVALYLLDEEGGRLEMTAGVGRAWSEEWRELAGLELASAHPAAGCLRGQQMALVRGNDERLNRAVAERFGLLDFVRVFLPLQAAGRRLGALELGYGGGHRLAMTAESKRRLAAFADQVAIAVHNMQLLHRTNEALIRQMEELRVARQIQLSMLPTTRPTIPGWTFEATYRSARQVGGDFYDHFRLPGEPPRLGMVIADVADKGAPAALFMALSRTIIRTTALSGRGPASALLRANELILNDSRSDLFLSAVYAVLELRTGRMIYTNAGHNRPLWYHAATGAFSTLGGRGIILGVFGNIKLEERRIDVAPGDVLVFYTDGVTEAMNEAGDLFEEGRLRAVTAAHAGQPAPAILRAIMAALAQFTGEAEQSDDVTCFVVKRG